MTSAPWVVVGGPAEIVKTFDTLEGLEDLQVMYDLPEICSVARYIFKDGRVGYEAFFTMNADVEDYATTMMILGGSRQIHMELWNLSPGGVMQYRTIWIEDAPLPEWNGMQLPDVIGFDF
ncbi:hypothetical protein [Catellatospora sichuanensis]|uniref:hypothetical protein n=1 Tax=Catellatospora sichuanensis TaxID=1969805 RepID=UPI0011834E1C|nr:hypothetical protein [Catellatospora sichuanensis]